VKTLESIEKVLALFDDEDIPYIKVEIVEQLTSNDKEKVQVKKLGDNHDRCQKQ